MKAIVIMDYPATDVDAIELYITALNNAYGVVGAVFKIYIINDKILALVKKAVLPNLCICLKVLHITSPLAGMMLLRK